MASIVVRNLDGSVKKALADQAKVHGRSMEAEAREILTAGVRARRERNLGLAFLELFAESAGEGLEIPERRERARAAVFEE